MKNKFNPHQQLLNNPTSRSLVIKAMCAECVGCSINHLEKGFREDISSCLSKHCPLYNFRPYRPKNALNSLKKGVDDPQAMRPQDECEKKA